MSKLFIHIDASELTEELPGNKTMLYYLVRRMGMVRMSVDELAQLFHVSRRSVINWLDELVSDEYIRKSYKSGKQLILQVNNSAKFAQSKVKKLHNQKCNNCTNDSAEVAPSTIYKNNILSNRVNNVENTPQCEVPKAEYYEYISEGIEAFYEGRFKRPYAPNWATHTTNAKELSGKVDTMLRSEGMELNDENRRTWWWGFLSRGYDAGDQYHRDNFTLDTLNKQFNNFLNKIQNGKSRQKPADQDAEYLARLQEILGK